MGYIYLAFQILLLFGTMFLSTGEYYLHNFKKISKFYFILEFIIQLLCVILNFIFLFVSEKLMLYILCFDICFAGIVNIICNLYCKNKYFKKLKEIIIEEKLINMESHKIRLYILEKYNLLYSNKVIENNILKIIKANN